MREIRLVSCAAGGSDAGTGTITINLIAWHMILGVLTSVSTGKTFFGGRSVRNDGTIFASSGGDGGIYTVDPSGSFTLLGKTGVGGVSDMAFAIPESGSGAALLIGLGAGSLFGARILGRRKWRLTGARKRNPSVCF